MKKYVWAFTLTLTFAILSVLAPASAQALPDSPAPVTAPSISKDKPVPKPRKIPEMYIQESMNVFDQCNSTLSMSENYDCECLASKFMELRMETGPQGSTQALLMNLRQDCRNSTKAAGVAYENCLRGVGEMLPGTDPEILCSCVGNTYAKLLDRDKPIITQATIIDYQTRAQMLCKNPDTARSLGIVAPK
jgi:hypothetical protein